MIAQLTIARRHRPARDRLTGRERVNTLAAFVNRALALANLISHVARAFAGTTRRAAHRLSWMSPFSYFLHELRLRRNLRQADLAALVGYEQSYLSALEVGLKGPPTAEFVERLIAALSLAGSEADDLKRAVAASQRKLEIDVDAPQDVYWLLNSLREKLPSLSPQHVRLLRDMLSMADADSEPWSDPRRRIARKKKEGAQ